MSQNLRCSIFRGTNNEITDDTSQLLSRALLHMLVTIAHTRSG